MNQPLRALATAASLLLLAGCTMLATTGRTTPGLHNESPVAINFPEVYQPKFQAMQHWQMAADTLADGLQRALPSSVECKSNGDCRVIIHVKRPCLTADCSPAPCDTNFSQVFHAFLEASLAKRGLRLTNDAALASLILTTQIHAVRFADDRPQFRAAGELVKLGEGVWALRDVAYAFDTVKGVPLEPTSRIVPNWFKTQFATGDTPAHELMVAVAAADQTKTIVAKTAAVYYFADQDSGHYLCPSPRPVSAEPAKAAEVAVPQTKTAEVSSPAARDTKREIRVLGDGSEPRSVQPQRPSGMGANP